MSRGKVTRGAITSASKIFMILRRIMSRKTDYIVIGAGLAGTTVAKQLMARGRRVVVIDNGAQSSSMIAGGLVNPLTGKRLVIDETFHKKFSRAEAEYADIPGALRTLPVIRILSDTTEVQSWQKKRDSLQEQHSISQVDFARAKEYLPTLNSKNHNCTIIVVPNAAHVNTAAVIATRKSWLAEHDALVETHVSLDDWDPSSHTIAGITAEQIILCDGWHLASHSVFSRVEMMPAKGQLLTVRIDTQPAYDVQTHPGAIVIHRGRFLVPLGNHLYRYGATYEWNDVNEDVLPSTTEFLSDSLREMIEVPFTVVDARAGVRPIVRDLSPVLGVHPRYSHVSILNGMGSKGALLAPTLSSLLIDHLERGTIIPPAYSVTRYYE